MAHGTLVSWCWRWNGPFIGHTPLYFCFVVIRLVWLIVQRPCRVSARQPNSFLLRGKKEPKKRAPFPGPAGYPSFATSARPVAKLAALKQRDWNSP